MKENFLRENSVRTQPPRISSIINLLTINLTINLIIHISISHISIYHRLIYELMAIILQQRYRCLYYRRRLQSRWSVFTPFVCVFCRTISQKPMQLWSPNLTQQHSTMSPVNPFIWRSRGQKLRSRMTHQGAACDGAIVHFGPAVSRTDIFVNIWNEIILTEKGWHQCLLCRLRCFETGRIWREKFFHVINLIPDFSLDLGNDFFQRGGVTWHVPIYRLPRICLQWRRYHPETNQSQYEDNRHVDSNV